MLTPDTQIKANHSGLTIHIDINDPKNLLKFTTLAELLTDFQSNLEDALNEEDSEISFSYASSDDAEKLTSTNHLVKILSSKKQEVI